MRGKRLTFLLIAAVILGALLFRSRLTESIGLGRVTLSPLERALGRGGSSIGGVLMSFLRTGSLAGRVRALETELATAQGTIAQLESLRDENAALRNALELQRRDTLPVVYANVIGPGTDGVTTVIRIDRGAADGIRPHAPVIAAERIVVGRVRDVYTKSATVDLLSGGQFRVAVRDLATNAQGIVRGVRGLDVAVEGVPRTETLHVGDRLVTTGIDGIFPPNLLVGTVRTVRAPEHAIFQEGSVQSPLDLHRLKLLGIFRESTP